MDDVKIGIGGLARLSRGLKAVSADAPKELRLALNSAADLLVDETRPKIPSLTGAARRSLVARSTRTTARVGVGGAKAKYYPWLDFGGEGRVKGRPARREFIREGRYIYPTLREIRPRIEAKLHESISAVIRNAGLEQG
jgi:hypothetical protein